MLRFFFPKPDCLGQKFVTKIMRFDCVLLVHILINPLSPMSDQYQFSPDITDTSSREKVMRISKMIIMGRVL